MPVGAHAGKKPPLFFGATKNPVSAIFNKPANSFGPTALEPASRDGRIAS